MAKIHLVTSALPEDLRTFLLEALPRTERDAVQTFGFERVNETPGALKHRYLEGYFHALYSQPHSTQLSVHPRWTDQKLERRPAPEPIAAFCEAVRRCNAVEVEKLVSRLEDAHLFSSPLLLALQRGGHFADVSVQLRWGGPVREEHADFHTDDAYSALHMAVGLQSERTLLVRGRANGVSQQKIERFPQRRGDVYLSTPCWFCHAVQYPEVRWDQRVVAMQLRLLLEPQELQEFRKGVACVKDMVTECLSTWELVLPSLEDVLAAAEDLRRVPPLPTSLGAAEREEILRGMKLDGLALQYEEDVAKADPDVVRAAVENNSAALRFASAELRADREIVLAAMRKDALTVQHVSHALLAEHTFAEEAVQLDARTLQYFTQEHKADPALVLAAVEKDGLLVRFASPALRGDRKVAEAAVRQNGKALCYLSLELRSDPAIVLLAAQQDVKLARYAAKELKELLDLFQAGEAHRVCQADIAAGSSGENGASQAASTGSGQRRRGKFSQMMDPAPLTASSQLLMDPARFHPPRSQVPLAGAGAGERQFQAAGARRPPLGKCYLAGSWDDWADAASRPMRWDGCCYRGHIEIRPPREEEDFQICVDKDWGKRIFPSVERAGLRTPHEVLGPSDYWGHGKDWCVSRRTPGGARHNRFEVVMRVDHAGKLSVTWEAIP